MTLTTFRRARSVQLQDLVNSEPEMVGIATPRFFLTTFLTLMALAALEMLSNYS